MKRENLWRWKRSPLPYAMVIAGIVVVLIIARLAMPYVLKSYANKQLNKSKDYSGHIGDVTVHLWCGAYQIHGIDINKKTGKVPVPFVSVSNLDLSLQWSELIHGKLVSKIKMAEPRLNFVQGPTPEQSQSGKEHNWGDTLESLVPFKINELIITNGQIHFENPASNPPV